MKRSIMKKWLAICIAAVLVIPANLSSYAAEPGKEPTQTTEGETPVVPGEEPTQMTEGETPVVPGEEPTQMTEGETPVVPGEEPTQETEGETPVVPGEEPTQETEGETPVVPGEEPTQEPEAAEKAALFSMPLAEGETVAKVDGTAYPSLKEAIAAADGKTVELTASTELTEAIVVDKNVTLDLKGFTVSGALSGSGSLITVKENGKLTIRDTSEGANGKISTSVDRAVWVSGSCTCTLESGTVETKKTGGTGIIASGEGAAFYMTGGSVTGVEEGVRAQLKAKIEISGGTVEATGEGYSGDALINTGAVSLLASSLKISDSAILKGYTGIGLFNVDMENGNKVTNSSTAIPSTVEMSGGSIECTVYAISGNCNQSATSKVTITGGTLKSTDTCIYWPMEGELNISGDTVISGSTGIEAKLGTINISGGTIEGNGEYQSVYTGNGESSDGSALKLIGQLYGSAEGQYITSPNLTANITGGTFKSTNGSAVSVYNNNKETVHNGSKLTADITISDAATLTSGSSREKIRIASSKDNYSFTATEVKTGNTTVKNAEAAKAVAKGTPYATSTPGGSQGFFVLYNSLGNAVADAGSTDVTLTLLQDTEEDLTVPENAKVTIDFNNKSLTGTIANSSDALKLTGSGTFNGEVTGKEAAQQAGTVKTVVAKVGKTGYATLADAIANAADGSTIVLTADVTESVTIPESKKLTIDLAGKTITNKASQHTVTVGKNAVVEFKDSSADKTGAVDNVSHGKAALYTKEGSKVTLNGGTFKRSQEKGTLAGNSANGNSYYTILNQGDLTINKGTTVELLLADGKPAGFSSIIDNGWYSGKPETTGYNAKLTINGGVLNGGKYIKNDSYGTMSVTGGEIKNGANASILNWNNLEITGGTFTPDSGAAGAVFNVKGGAGAEDGKAVISGGHFVTTENQQVIFTSNDANKSEDAEISGGTFTQPVPEEWLADGFNPQKNPDGSYGVHVHQTDGGKVTKEPTTEVEGEKTYSCKICGEVLSVEKLPRLLAMLDEKENVTSADKSYTLNSGSTVSIHASGTLKDFVKVTVDEKEVASSNYTLAEGSTLLTFKNAYLDTLSVGAHTVTMYYKTGVYASDTVSVILNVSKAEDSGNSGSGSSSGSSSSSSSSGSSSTASSVKAAKTGDSANPLLWTGLALAAVLVLGGVVVYKKRKETKK